MDIEAARQRLPRPSEQVPAGAGGLRAVVLAAGRSSRLSEVTAGGSKALLRVGGVALVERAVRRLLALGIHEVIVVVGHHAGPVSTVVNGIAPGRARALLAERWEGGNGASLAAAELELAEDPLFLVVTADHVFGDGALDSLLSLGRPAALVDRTPADAVWAEGTRVRVADEHAIAFSKDLAEPAVDCGAFVLPPAIFDAQREAVAEGDGSLAGALSRLSARRPIAAVALPPKTWWHDIDTLDDVREARRMLRRSLAKPTDGPVSRFLNRPVSTRISMAVSPLRPSPNLVSVAALIVTAVAAALLWGGDGVSGGLLVQLASVIDGVDGEVARLQDRASARGALLDGVLDRVGDAAIVAALAIWSLSEGTVTGTWAVALAVTATSGCMLSMATKDRVAALGLPAAPERRLNLLFGGRDARLLLIAITAVLGRPLWGLGMVVVTTTITLVVRLASVARSSRSVA